MKNITALLYGLTSHEILVRSKRKLIRLFGFKKRIELWWFYLSEEDKRVMRFTGAIMIELSKFLALIAMLAFIYLLPYFLHLIADYFNLDI